MKLHFKISLIVVAIAVVFAIIAAIGGDAGAIALTFGITCCVAGLACFVIGLLVAINPKHREVGRAMLLSAGLTFLIGTGACSTYLL